MNTRIARLIFALSLTLVVEAETTLEEKGREVFRACNGCHNYRTDARKMAPSLRTLFGKVLLMNGKRTTEGNVVELVTEGYNRMPSYKYMLRPKDWEELMAFLKTLRGRPEFNPVLRPIRGTDDEVLSAGKAHYMDHCASCHAQPGGKAPDLLGMYKRDALGDGERPGEAPILRRTRDGHGGMPPKADVLDDSSLFALMAFLKAQ